MGGRVVEGPQSCRGTHLSIQEGKYHSWIKDGMVNDWIVIDYGTSLPSSVMSS
jgi:hypothetical protein